MRHTTPSARPLSVSQIRTFMHCGYAWRLIYEQRHLRALSAVAFYGRLVHQVIRLAYHGLPMEAAHQSVWASACGAVLPKLEQLIALDAEYAAIGKPQSKAAQLWRERHPEYDALLCDAGIYQDTALGHLKWGEKSSLIGFYRRAVALLDHEPDIVLPNPILVEGQAPGSVDQEHEADTAAPIDDMRAGVRLRTQAMRNTIAATRCCTVRSAESRSSACRTSSPCTLTAGRSESATTRQADQSRATRWRRTRS